MCPARADRLCNFATAEARERERESERALAMATNLGSLRKSRAGHLRTLERRLANLDRELRQCEGADALQKDKSLIGPARYTSSKCEESLNNLAEVIESIENLLSSADPPLEQTEKISREICRISRISSCDFSSFLY